MDDKELKWILAHTEDEIQWVIKHHRPVSTNFYTPYEAKGVEGLLNRWQEISYQRSGGYPEAERTAFWIHPVYAEPEASDFLQVINITWNSRYYCLEHRDLLGALMAIGVKREKIGDILAGDGTAHVFVDKNMTDYITNALNKAGKAPLTLQVSDIGSLALPKTQTRSIRTTVASPRLDSIVSACFGISRSKMMPLIAGGSVRINWEVVAKPDYTLHEGDTISVRGYGRGRVASFGPVTRKNRLTVTLERL